MNTIIGLLVLIAIIVGISIVAKKIFLLIYKAVVPASIKKTSLDKDGVGLGGKVIFALGGLIFIFWILWPSEDQLQVIKEAQETADQLQAIKEAQEAADQLQAIKEAQEAAKRVAKERESHDKLIENAKKAVKSEYPYSSPKFESLRIVDGHVCGKVDGVHFVMLSYGEIPIIQSTSYTWKEYGREIFYDVCWSRK